MPTPSKSLASVSLLRLVPTCWSPAVPAILGPHVPHLHVFPPCRRVPMASTPAVSLASRRARVRLLQARPDRMTLRDLKLNS